MLTMNRESYDTKLFGAIQFEDYWNLEKHPLYLKLNKKEKPYLLFNEEPIKGYEKVKSLTDVANFLRRNDWAFQNKYWGNISHTIQAAINLPYTEL